MTENLVITMIPASEITDGVAPPLIPWNGFDLTAQNAYE